MQVDRVAPWQSSELEEESNFDKMQQTDAETPEEADLEQYPTKEEELQGQEQAKTQQRTVEREITSPPPRAATPATARPEEPWPCPFFICLKDLADKNEQVLPLQSSTTCFFISPRLYLFCPR